MNKIDYIDRSSKLKLTPRCPLIGRCPRWAYTLEFFTSKTPDHSFSRLKSEGHLPNDFEQTRIPLEPEAPWHNRTDDTETFDLCCPEVPLFFRNFTPSFLPKESITGADWIRSSSSLQHITHGHYSECPEISKNHNLKTTSSNSRNVSLKDRFTVLDRDDYRCVYCGKSRNEGAILEIDHAQSVNDGGSSDPTNLVTSCFECNRGKGKKSVTLQNKSPH